MTTTLVISAQSIGTGANAGAGLFPQKLTIQTTTTAFVICGRITNDANPHSQKDILRIWYSSSSFSITAANAILQLAKTARYLDIRKPAIANMVNILDSSLEPITGSSIYLWCDVPTATTALTLDVNVVELP